MITDRLSLTYIYNALRSVEENDGKIDSILLNKTSHYGKKTVPRFSTLNELKDFINEIYPFTPPLDNCKCYTNSENVYDILSFSFKKEKETVFLNNLEAGWQTAKPKQINSITFKNLNNLRNLNEKLQILFKNYVCFPYIEFGYIECEYIEVIRNDAYYELLDIYKNIKIKD